MLIARRAIVYVSTLSVKDELARGNLALLEVDGLRIERPLQKVWLTGRSLAPSARAFSAWCWQAWTRMLRWRDAGRRGSFARDFAGLAGHYRTAVPRRWAVLKTRSKRNVEPNASTRTAAVTL